MDANGFNKRQITHNLVADYTPKWTADGNNLVYISQKNDINQIYKIDILSGETTNLSNTTFSEYLGSIRYFDNKIAYTSDTNDDVYRDMMYMNVDGSGRQFVAESDTCSDYYPTWSPSGSYIVFTRYTHGGDEGVFAINSDGSNLHKLNNTFGRGYAFSPDGTKIAFGHDQDGITVMNVDGSNPVAYPVSAETARFPSWSPDGTKIAFDGWDGHDYEIYVMNADGTNFVQLTDNNVDDYYPDWSPLH